MPIGAMSAAMADAVPPLDPPALTFRFTGFRVNPNILFDVLISVANSGVFVLPIRFQLDQLQIASFAGLNAFVPKAFLDSMFDLAIVVLRSTKGPSQSCQSRVLPASVASRVSLTNTS